MGNKNKLAVKTINVNKTELPISKPKSLAITSTFKKDMKKVSRYPKFKISVYEKIVNDLVNGVRWDKEKTSFDFHKLVASGVKFQGYWDVHVAPNICMIYDVTPDTVTLIRIGSHSDLGLTESL